MQQQEFEYAQTMISTVKFEIGILVIPSFDMLFVIFLEKHVDR